MKKRPQVHYYMQHTIGTRMRYRRRHATLITSNTAGYSGCQ